MPDKKYVAVFQHLSTYSTAAGDTPDQHDGPFATKSDALLAAREHQITMGRDPNFVLDLTGVPSGELAEFLR
ncbi:hypothetical protein DSM25559_2967 [Agrobacterium rosae]|uniref:Uncharacterized protein n=1 Tax=Agrobacterium rosae TaxID=1972867 RepID=A0A1R3TYS1_9HYPH|nr:hypothetical protein DSM25559_2967 [Agrobacterium rosae]